MVLLFAEQAQCQFNIWLILFADVNSVLGEC